MAIAPTTTPTHCHHIILSWKMIIEKMLVTASEPIIRTGYTMLAERRVASIMTRRFCRKLKIPHRRGIYQDLERISFELDLSLLRYTKRHTAKLTAVAHIIKKSP